MVFKGDGNGCAGNHGAYRSLLATGRPRYLLDGQNSCAGICQIHVCNLQVGSNFRLAGAQTMMPTGLCAEAWRLRRTKRYQHRESPRLNLWLTLTHRRERSGFPG
jgi:hypothetical protein